jgi:ABC-type transporter Mla MlaB component
MSLPGWRRLDGCSAAVTEVRGLAEPLAPQPEPAWAPDDPPGTVRLRGSIGRADVDAECARARDAMLGCRTPLVACDLVDVDTPSLAIVEILARLTLLAVRNGQSVRIVRPPAAIRELIGLCGLAEVLPDAESGGEVRR